jgi:putative ABC transport system ATP-binding protein
MTVESSTTAAAIAMRGLRFAYPGGEFTLDVPELDVATGTRTAVVGPSGSGKTTLLHLVAGVYLPERGTVTVGDVTVSELGDAARRAFRITTVGFVFQDFELLDYLDVRENVLLPYMVNPVMRLTSAVRASADQLLADLGLGDKRHRRITALSQGERQRVAICRALLPSPKVLLADEPTGNLDPTTSHRIVDLLLQRSRTDGTTLILVTHDHTLLGAFDRVIDFETFRASEKHEIRNTKSETNPKLEGPKLP